MMVKNIFGPLLITVYVFLSSFSLIGMRRFLEGDKGLSMYLNPYALLAIFGYGCSFILWTLIVSRNNVTFIYPLTVGLNFMIVYIGSAILLKEQMTLHNSIGAVLILIGVVVILLK